MHKSRFCLLFVLFTLLQVQSFAASPLTGEQAVPPSVLFELLVLNKDLPTPKSPKYLSPSDLVVSPDGTLLFVAGQTAKQVVVIDPAASPYFVKGNLSDAAMHGKALFYDDQKVDCIMCHPPALFTDCKFWNAGISDPFDAGTQWITPELTEIWRTAPYNHLGGMTLREIIEFPGHNNAAKKLSAQEIDDLVAYMLSL